MTRVTLPEDFSFIESCAAGDRVYFQLNPSEDSENLLGYVLSSPDGSSELVDVSDDFYFSSTWTDGDGVDHFEERLAIPNCILPYKDRWIAYFPGEPFC